MSNYASPSLVVRPTTEVFGSPLNELVQLLPTFNRLPKTGELLVDLTDAGFIRPTLFLPLAALLNRHEQEGGTVRYVDAHDRDAQIYLSTILFHKGLVCNQGSQAELEKYHSKSYLPILSIPVDANASQNTSQITQAASAILKRSSKLAQGVQSALNYLVSEALDNINQHSSAVCGWMQMQVYPNLNYADLCITDTGRTILGSYRDAQFDEVTDDTIAMMRALNGRSVKQTEMGRGYGIRTSRKMLQQGLKGIHFLWSGGAAATTRNGQDHILQLPKELHFPGTIIALRIPLTAPSNFSVYDYVEG